MVSLIVSRLDSFARQLPACHNIDHPVVAFLLENKHCLPSDVKYEIDIKRHGNWKSNSVPDRYQAVNANTATKTALKIGEKLVETTNIQQKQKNQFENTEINPCKMFTNCMFNNCTINF
uniref:Uncharacterized protein n=1 Tax=Naegleria fowleri TaxID=5763 RepID=M1GR68_NAEFO|nr:hypothetical protein [Naegleria fowleri]